MDSKGKRHFRTSHSYQQADFLKHHDVAAARAPQFQPVSHTSTTKFKKGFYRRPEHQIWPGREEHRLKREEDTMPRQQAHALRRREYLVEQDRRNGDIIKHADTQASHIAHCAGRRHFRDGAMSREAEATRRIRDRNNPGSRFHLNATVRQKYGNEHREKTKTTTICGINGAPVNRPKQRLPSEGVLDNFRGFGYANSLAHADGGDQQQQQSKENSGGSMNLTTGRDRPSHEQIAASTRSNSLANAAGAAKRSQMVVTFDKSASVATAKSKRTPKHSSIERSQKSLEHPM